MVLPCSYTPPRGQTVTVTGWFIWRSGQWSNIQYQPEYAGRVEYRGDKERDCTLRITDLRENDSALYKFRFITNNGRIYGKPGVTLSVTGNILI